VYRDLRLWEAAVREGGSLDQEDVIGALDHAKIAVGPGGPPETVPGQHHVRMNMYIAQVRDGAIKIVKGLGVIDPDERTGIASPRRGMSASVPSPVSPQTA
jgi:ABC-type branched-subunit amino acid transport system substrate-binding protein